MIWTIGVILFIVVILLWLAQSYNHLVRLYAVVREAWSGVEVQLQRRYDLVPQLVETVKQYQIHEREVLQTVTDMRTRSMQADSLEEKSTAEAGLSNALKSLFAVSENYPNLKANENFMQLQQELSRLEDEIQLARRYYNGATRNYNILVQSFPSRIVAHVFGFSEQPYFTLHTSKAHEPPEMPF